MLDGLILFAITEALFSVSPGPAVVLVMAATMAGGWKAGNGAVFGVLVGNLVYFVISCALVLSATQYNDELFLYIKIAGAGYLFYLIFVRYCRPASSTADEDVAQTQIQARNHFFKSSLVMQLSNPKTILFFSAFLPQFVDPRYDITLQFTIMAGLSWAIEYTILACYIFAGQMLLKRFKTDNLGNRLEHLGNAVMVIAIGWSLSTTWF